MTEAQADGRACVVCGTERPATGFVPVGRSATGSQVFACAECTGQPDDVDPDYAMQAQYGRPVVVGAEWIEDDA